MLEMLIEDDHSFDLKRQKQMEKEGQTPGGRMRRSNVEDPNEYNKLSDAVLKKFGVALPKALSFLEKKKDDTLYNKMIEMTEDYDSEDQENELNQQVNQKLNQQ